MKPLLGQIHRVWTIPPNLARPQNKWLQKECDEYSSLASHRTFRVYTTSKNNESVHTSKSHTETARDKFQYRNT